MAVAVAALSGLLYLQWHDWPPGPRLIETVEDAAVTAGSTTGEALDPLADLELPRDRQDFDVVSQRPLFRPDRRPKKEEKGPQEPEVAQEATELDGFDLTAVLITGDKKRAWLKNPKEQKASKVREGDDVSGWTVTKIEADLITLERHGEPHKIDLLDFTKPAAPPARRGRAARGVPPAKSTPTKPSASPPSRATRQPRTNRNVRIPSQAPARPTRTTRPPRG